MEDFPGSLKRVALSHWLARRIIEEKMELNNSSGTHFLKQIPEIVVLKDLVFGSFFPSQISKKFTIKSLISLSNPEFDRNA